MNQRLAVSDERSGGRQVRKDEAGNEITDTRDIWLDISKLGRAHEMIISEMTKAYAAKDDVALASAMRAKAEIERMLDKAHQRARQHSLKKVQS